jgi:hypothetical protein
MSDKQFEEAVEGHLKVKAREQKRSEIIAANEKSRPVRGVQTDGIFGYLGCNGMGVEECEAGLILDNGIAYGWHFVDGNHETIEFEATTQTRNKLAGIVNAAGMLGRRLQAKRCPSDAGSSYLFLARHNAGGGRLAWCAQPEKHELTNAGFSTLEGPIKQLLSSVESGEIQSQRIDFDVMTQRIRHYAAGLSAGDKRRAQVDSWVLAVTSVIANDET